MEFELPDNVVEVVRCKRCKHKPVENVGFEHDGERYEWPDDVCPLQVMDHWYDSYLGDNFFCAFGAR